jgi:hypothetical protein
MIGTTARRLKRARGRWTRTAGDAGLPPQVIPPPPALLRVLAILFVEFSEESTVPA